MDRRAEKILFDTFWSSAGWKQDAGRETTAEEFEYAKSKGVMFSPVELDHSEAQERLIGAIGLLSKQIVANAFLASLSTRRLDWRSVLGSYAVFQHLPKHSFSGTARQCSICGLYKAESTYDLNVLNFERLKWGGVRHSQIIYAAMDLTLFLEGEQPKPTDEDILIFKALISAIESAPIGTSSAALHTLFPKSLKANKPQRDVIIEIIGYCGVLRTPSHPGFSTDFVSYDQRNLPDRRFVDMDYPACWWSSEEGTNKAQLANYFGHVL
jgi:hypothetical protein